MSSMGGGSCFDNSNLYYNQASLMGLSGSHGNLQDPLQMRQNMLYTNCGGGVPNIILTGSAVPQSPFSFFHSFFSFFLSVLILTRI